MSDQVALGILIVNMAVLAGMLMFPANRRRTVRWFKSAYIEMPVQVYISGLRKITGRRSPDYTRIAELEHEARGGHGSAAEG